MARQYIGIDAGENRVSVAVLEESDKRLSLLWCGREEFGEGHKSVDLHHALSALLKRERSKEVIAIGANVDASNVLTTKRTLPFNAPRVIEQILAQNVSDLWSKSDEMQLSFEVVGEIESQNEEEGKNYEIFVLSYPREALSAEIAKYKEAGVDPQVLLPEQNASPSAISLLFSPPAKVWAILDIGATQSVFTVFSENTMLLSRSIKLGSAIIDETFAEEFELTLKEAKTLKERSAFVSPPQFEDDWGAHFVAAGNIVQSEYEFSAISQLSSRALGRLLSVLNQSLASIRVKEGAELELLLITGAGSLLPGLDHLLASQLATQTSRIEQVLPWEIENSAEFSWAATVMAANAHLYSQEQCPLNLRQGQFAYKGSLEFINDHKWKLVALFTFLIVCMVFMAVMQFKAVNTESTKLRAALENASEEILGRRILSKNAIIDEMDKGATYAFIPKVTAFKHFEWLSTHIHDNLSDVEFELTALEIDSYQKKVVLRGEVVGDEGLPKIMKLLESYECFPDEIQEPRTQKVKDQVSFTLRIDANHCLTGGESE
ncbi:MAG: pilus assembly protein PilM [Bradymonadales bacterium]